MEECRSRRHDSVCILYLPNHLFATSCSSSTSTSTSTPPPSLFPTLYPPGLCCIAWQFSLRPSPQHHLAPVAPTGRKASPCLSPPSTYLALPYQVPREAKTHLLVEFGAERRPGRHTTERTGQAVWLLRAPLHWTRGVRAGRFHRRG